MLREGETHPITLRSGAREEAVMQTATLISHNGHQSVQLPEGIQIPGSEVYVKRIGQSVLLIPKDADPWDLMAESLEHFTSDFMTERCQPVQQPREGLTS